GLSLSSRSPSAFATSSSRAAVVIAWRPGRARHMHPALSHLLLGSPSPRGGSHVPVVVAVPVAVALLEVMAEVLAREGEALAQRALPGLRIALGGDLEQHGALPAAVGEAPQHLRAGLVALTGRQVLVLGGPARAVGQVQVGQPVPEPLD